MIDDDSVKCKRIKIILMKIEIRSSKAHYQKVQFVLHFLFCIFVKNYPLVLSRQPHNKKPGTSANLEILSGHYKPPYFLPARG